MCVCGGGSNLETLRCVGYVSTLQRYERILKDSFNFYIMFILKRPKRQPLLMHMFGGNKQSKYVIYILSFTFRQYGITSYLL